MYVHVRNILTQQQDLTFIFLTGLKTKVVLQYSFFIAVLFLCVSHSRERCEFYSKPGEISLHLVIKDSGLGHNFFLQLLKLAF